MGLVQVQKPNLLTHPKGAGAIAEERIDPRRAGLLLYALSTASCNLKHASFEPAELRGQQEEKPSALVQILINELGLDIPGMPSTKKDLPPPEVKVGDYSLL